jgi:hypothetical protein
MNFMVTEWLGLDKKKFILGTLYRVICPLIMLYNGVSQVVPLAFCWSKPLHTTYTE